MNRLHAWWVELRDGFWVVPGLIIVISIVAALILIDLDSSASQDWTD